MFRPGNYVINQEKKRQREEMREFFCKKCTGSLCVKSFSCDNFILLYAELVAKRNLVCGCTDDGFSITGAVFILSWCRPQQYNQPQCQNIIILKSIRIFYSYNNEYLYHNKISYFRPWKEAVRLKTWIWNKEAALMSKLRHQFISVCVVYWVLT